MRPARAVLERGDGQAGRRRRLGEDAGHRGLRRRVEAHQRPVQGQSVARGPRGARLAAHRGAATLRHRVVLPVPDGVHVGPPQGQHEVLEVVRPVPVLGLQGAEGGASARPRQRRKAVGGLDGDHAVVVSRGLDGRRVRIVLHQDGEHPVDPGLPRPGRQEAADGLLIAARCMRHDQQRALDLGRRQGDPGVLGHEGEPLGVGVLPQDLAQRHGAHPLVAVGVGLDLLEPTSHLRPRVRRHHEVAEHEPQPAGEVADHQRVGGQELEHPAGEHGLGLLHGVQVEVDRVALVGDVQQVRRQRAAHDEPLVLLREGVVGVPPAQVAVVDVEPPAIRGELRAELPQIRQPLGVAGVVGAGEGAPLHPLEGLHGIGVDRLGRERQEVHVAVPELALVARDAVQVRGEDRVEVARRGEERVEVHRILLVPEGGGHTPLTAPPEDALQLGAEPMDGVPPGLAVPAPRGLHEQQVRLRRRQLGAPVLHGQRHQVRLALEGGEGELVQDAGHDELPGPAGASADRHRIRLTAPRRDVLGNHRCGDPGAHACPPFLSARMIEMSRGTARRTPVRLWASRSALPAWKVREDRT